MSEKDANKPILGESWIESDPVGDITKMLLSFSNQEIPTIYCISKLCPWIKLCQDKTNVSDKHWALVFLCLGQ